MESKPLKGKRASMFSTPEPVVIPEEPNAEEPQSAIDSPASSVWRNEQPEQVLPIEKVLEAAAKAGWTLLPRTDVNFRQLTVSGYPYAITGTDGLNRTGEVEMPNGEIVDAVWDKDGNEVGGNRPNLKI